MKEGFVFWLEQDLYRTCVYVGFYTLGAPALTERLCSVAHHVKVRDMGLGEVVLLGPQIKLLREKARVPLYRIAPEQGRRLVQENWRAPFARPEHWNDEARDILKGPGALTAGTAPADPGPGAEQKGGADVLPHQAAV